MKLADFSINHPVIITIVAITVLVFGVVALLSLTSELIPDSSLPTLVVVTTYPGVGPSEMEERVTRVLEDELAPTSGLSAMSSQSMPSASTITLEFNWETDVDAKLPEVRERINNVLPDLPDDLAGPPQIIKVTSGIIPIFSVSISSTSDPYALAQYAADELVPALSQIDGVATVALKGYRDRELQVIVDPARLTSREIDILQVMQVLSVADSSVPAGELYYRGDQMSLRSVGSYDSPEKLRRVVIGALGGSPVLVRDVADLRFVDTEPEIHVYLDGAPTIAFDITKRRGADAPAIIAEARRVMKQAEERFAGAVTFTELRDQGRDVEVSTQTVRNAALMGALLAVFVLFLFLRSGTSTFIVGISIPFAVVVAFLALYANNQTLNKTTLGGLTVSIGMIVDSAIVILENIYRHFRGGKSAVEAASIGSDEVGGAVFASISTTLAVFVPLIFVQGIAGIMLQDVALTIVYALVGSLVAALVLVPFLASKLLHRDRPSAPRAGPTDTVTDAERSDEAGGLLSRILLVYGRALERTLAAPGFPLVVAVMLLALTVSLFGFLGFEFLPTVDTGEIVLMLETPVGSDIDYTAEKALAMQRIIDREVPEAAATLFYVGQQGSFGTTQIPTRAYGVVRLAPATERSRSASDIIDVLRTTTVDEIPNVRAEFNHGGLSETVAAATGGAGFQVVLYGRDLDAVFTSAEVVQDLLLQDSGVAAVSRNVERSYQEITAAFDLPVIGLLGLTPQEAAIAARAYFTGVEVGEIDTDQGRVPVVVTSSVSGLPFDSDVWNRIKVRSQSGSLVAFSAFTDILTDRTFAQIPHRNRQPAVTVTGELAAANARDVRSRTVSSLEALSLPIGVEWEIVGQSAEMIDSFRSLLFAALASIFLVYVVMVIQFERFLQPLIVLSSIPFTMIGVILTLLVFGTTLSIVSFLGIIALAGIVVNNAIVMIDYTNLLRTHYGVPLRTAVVMGASSRLRPILMTTLTTILGLIPMALGIGEGAEFLAPLGQAIAGGLVSSTAVTLFVVPVLYYLLERVVERRSVTDSTEQNGQAHQSDTDDAVQKEERNAQPDGLE